MGSTVKLIANGLSGNTTVDCTSIDGYDKLTAEDFLVVITQINITEPAISNQYNRQSGATVVPAFSYNPSTGILTTTGMISDWCVGNYGDAYNYRYAAATCVYSVYKK